MVVPGCNAPSLTYNLVDYRSFYGSKQTVLFYQTLSIVHPES